MFSRLVRKAIEIKKTNNSNTRFKHVAFILKGRRIVAIGWNKKKSHPAMIKYKYNDKCNHIHAELDAIIRFGNTDCRDKTLVVIRLLKDNTIANSKPCIGCQHVIEQVGFKNVYFSANGRFLKYNET